MITTKPLFEHFDVEKLRKQFPILQREVKGRPLVYLDNAATTQKPQVVIDSLVNYYSGYNANIHRGIHTLAEEATAAFEATRDTVKQFINAGTREEIIFTRGTTEGINLVAFTWGEANVHKGDEVLITAMEHHSNIVPWYELCKRKEAVLKTVDVREDGTLNMEAFKSSLSQKTKLVAVVHASNSLGTINPVEEIINLSHNAGAVVLVDGAQSSVHLDIDVTQMNCDFFVFSSHKVYGPTGVGVLYGKHDLLQSMPVFNGGGEMIKEVDFDKITYNDLPYKFEAGTPSIADTIALQFALKFVTDIGKQNIRKHEAELLAYATEKLQQIDGLTMVGTAADKVSVASFVVDKVHPQDIGVLLDNKGIAVRTGHHCTQPLMKRYGIPGTTRASFALYNTIQEIDVMIEALQKAIKILR